MPIFLEQTVSRIPAVVLKLVSQKRQLKLTRYFQINELLFELILVGV
jgi:hypothetical protein